MKRQTEAPSPTTNSADAWTRMISLTIVLATAFACAAPIGVVRVDSGVAQQDLTHNTLTEGMISEKAQILLRRINQEEAWRDDPAAVLAFIHSLLAVPANEFNSVLRANSLASIAELTFAHAAETKDQRYYLAAALYAWLYLFPNGESTLPPASLERGVRMCADIYNRGVTLALTNPETGEVELEDGEYALPFGTLTIDLDESSLRWGDRKLTRFASLADLRVRGLKNRHRVSGIGAPLAGRVSGDEDDRDMVFAKVRVPVSALLRFQHPEAKLGGDQFHAGLSVIAYSEAETASIAGQRVPLEVEPSAALALQLTEAPPWQRELKGFFQGDLALGRLGLVSLEPYKRGRIPMVLVHGTASSAGRWADLLNDLESDPVLRHHYQFWLFSYNTGSPVAYSGWLLRKSISDLVHSLDPQGLDPALRSMVVMGHSQGGLLTKLLTVDSQRKFWDLVIDQPPDQVKLEPENRALLEGSLLVEPSPFVKRVIFLSTPHLGSRLATLGPARLLGRMVRTPANIVTAVGDVFSSDNEAEVKRKLASTGGAVGNMSPSSPFIQELARLPISPRIHAHSIMGVKKGPKEEGTDGVVSYQSAHLDDVDSELVVQSGHSSQSNPLVVNEVRRILIEHLEEAINERVVSSLEKAKVE